MWLLLAVVLLQEAKLAPAPAVAQAWKTVEASARRAGYDLFDVKVEDVVVLGPGARAPKDRRFIRVRSAANLEPALIDLAVDEKFGGDRALKLAIKSVNRLLHKQAEALDLLKKESKISEEQWKELRRQLLE